MTEHTHKWIGDTARVRPGGERITDGQEFSPTTHELRVWPDRIVALSAGESGDAGGEDNPAEPDVGADVETVDGIGPALADELRGLGYETTDGLRAADVGALTAVDGISEKAARDIKRQVGDAAGAGGE